MHHYNFPGFSARCQVIYQPVVLGRAGRVRCILINYRHMDRAIIKGPVEAAYVGIWIVLVIHVSVALMVAAAAVYRHLGPEFNGVGGTGTEVFIGPGRFAVTLAPVTSEQTNGLVCRVRRVGSDHLFSNIIHSAWLASRIAKSKHFKIGSAVGRCGIEVARTITAAIGYAIIILYAWSKARNRVSVLMVCTVLGGWNTAITVTGGGAPFESAALGCVQLPQNLHLGIGTVIDEVGVFVHVRGMNNRVTQRNKKCKDNTIN